MARPACAAWALALLLLAPALTGCASADAHGRMTSAPPHTVAPAPPPVTDWRTTRRVAPPPRTWTQDELREADASARTAAREPR